MSDLARQKSVLERERDSIVDAIRELRTRARKRSIEASATRQPLLDAEIKFWRDGIAKHQADLMAVQAKLGALNKVLRAAAPARQLKTLGQLPLEPKSASKVEAAPNNSEQNSQDVFLSCFYMIARDSLDPRLFAALERDAQALALDHQKMHQQ